jgi:competence protein ComFB
MGESNKNSYVLVNITEQLVRKKVREMMKDLDMCQCEKCFLDACAIILNQQLDPHYVTTKKGELLTLLDATGYQYKTDLTVSVLQALKAVKEHPQH